MNTYKITKIEDKPENLEILGEYQIKEKKCPFDYVFPAAMTKEKVHDELRKNGQDLITQSEEAGIVQTALKEDLNKEFDIVPKVAEKPIIEGI